MYHEHIQVKDCVIFIYESPMSKAGPTGVGGREEVKKGTQQVRGLQPAGTGLPVPGTPLSLGQAGTLVTEVMHFLCLMALPSVLKEGLPLS